ncbi:hypothetical protein QI18_04795 [Lactococcus lactis subsp. lactis]|nr:hypothetical protein QI18_04795 [Lactococcus lactis subsp. lactis]
MRKTMTKKRDNLKILVHTAIYPWDTYTDKDVIDMDWVSGNSGNQLFRWALLNLFNQVPHENFVNTWDFSHDKVLQKKKYDYFLLPMSNTLREGGDDELKLLIDIMKQTEAKVLLVGLGGLFPREGFQKLSNEALIREFIETALAKTEVIGLRDNYAYQYLTDYLGYPTEKFEIVGCPSVTYQGYKLEKKDYYPIKRDRYHPVDEDFKIAVNYIGGEYDYHWASFIDKVLFENKRMDVFFQDIDEARLLTYGTALADDRRHDLLVGDTQHFAYLEKRVKFFAHPLEWMDELKNYKFSIGTRIHGNIAAALAGIPVMIIATDSNTAGLAEFHHLPYIWDYELTEKTSLEELYYRACAEMENFYASFAENYDRYMNFIVKNGIDVAFLDKKYLPERLLHENNTIVASLINDWDVYMDEVSPYFTIQAKKEGVIFSRTSQRISKVKKEFWSWQNFRTKMPLLLNHKYRISIFWEGTDKDFSIRVQDESDAVKVSDSLVEEVHESVFEVTIMNDDIDHIGLSDTFKKGTIRRITIVEVKDDEAK